MPKHPLASRRAQAGCQVKINPLDRVTQLLRYTRKGRTDGGFAFGRDSFLSLLISLSVRGGKIFERGGGKFVEGEELVFVHK